MQRSASFALMPVTWRLTFARFTCRWWISTSAMSQSPKFFRSVAGPPAGTAGRSAATIQLPTAATARTRPTMNAIVYTVARGGDVLMVLRRLNNV